MTPEMHLDRLGAIRERFEPGGKVAQHGASLLPLPTVRASALAELPTPSRAFLDSGSLLPMRNVTMLSGDGRTGKSLLALQLAVATVLEAPWLGMTVRTGGVLYVSAEDDLDEMHVRLKDIGDAEGHAIAAMKELEIVALAGTDAVLATEAAKGSLLSVSPLFGRLRLNLDRLRPRLLVLDNLADVFAGNENVRPLARQFIGLLRGLAIEFDCAVLLLAHPSLSGLNSGTGASGNTAWNNSVRSRLYLVREKDQAGLELDPDCRVLQTMKANHAATGGQIRLRWEAGRFRRIDVMQEGDRLSRAMRAERVFMDLLRWHISKGIALSPSKSQTYAPAVFARHPQAEGVTSREFETAMNVLLDQNRIDIVEEGPPSRRRRRIVARQPGMEER